MRGIGINIPITATTFSLKVHVKKVAVVHWNVELKQSSGQERFLLADYYLLKNVLFT